MKHAIGVFALLAITACSVDSAGDENDVHASICEPLLFEDASFTHCTALPTIHDIRMELAPDGEETPYRSLAALAEDVGEDGAGIALAVNGGMFDPDGDPIGYYVEDGRRQTVLNQNEGPGNFHLLPNGVFFGESPHGPWRVWSTPRFARDTEGRPQFATQSGPMLVIDGELHPDIDPDGTSYKIRNAVGVDDAGRAHFVISEAPVSFGKLARLYRDVLNVDNALFLDGTVSQMWDPVSGRLDTGAPIGPLIIVYDREPTQ